MDLQLKGWQAKHIPLQRQYDQYLIYAIREYDATIDEKLKLNRCRIYLQAWTLSDLVDGDCIHLTQFAYNGRRDTSRTSSMQ